MSNEYDIVHAFQRIEEILIKSMKRNLTKHLNEEKDLDINWSAWQAEQLKSLELFRKNNKNLFKNDFSTINDDIEDLIRKSYENGKLHQEKIILEAIQEGNFKSNNKQINKLWNIYSKTKNSRIKKKQLSRIYDLTNQTEASLFKINERKLKALINETTENFKKAETSILRYTNDQYRKAIYDAQVYANTGAGTVQQAVDMATKDFFSKGINSIQYANGVMVNIASYANMAIRTANKRAYLQGEGVKRQEWGVHTVLVPNRGGGCPYCIKFQGKVFIDDVWSGGTVQESKETGYSLLSKAIKEKLFHPNCKDTIITYYPGITKEPVPPTKEELQQKIQNYKNEQKLNYINRNIEKYKRLELESIDKENIEKYHKKRLQWQDYKNKYKENIKIDFYDSQEYKKFKKVIKDESNDKLEDFVNIKYNNIDEYKLMKDYIKEFEDNRFPTDMTFEIYKNNLSNVNWQAVGFNPSKLQKHFDKHFKDFDIKTKEEYEQFSKDFMNKEIKDNIEGFISEEGFVFRYDTEKNIFGTAKPNGITETCFKPIEGRKYWEEQIKKYGKKKL